MNQKCKTNRITCRYCPQTGMHFLLPPLCQQSLDLNIVITYLKRTHQPVTTAQLKVLATHYQGEVSIGVNEIEPLLVQISQMTRPA